MIVSRITLVALCLVLPGSSPAQSSRSTPTPRPVLPGGASPTPSSAGPASLPDVQKQALSKAAEKVLTPIQDQESLLYNRFEYFTKPARLDPNSYASLDEVAQWKGLLLALKDRSAQVSTLYANVGKNIDAELSGAAVDQQVALKFKQVILSGFDWPVIHKKEQLLGQFIELHGKLLDFYEKNWGQWKSGGDPSKPEFTDRRLQSTYDKLREQIVTTGEAVEKQYQALSQ